MSGDVRAKFIGQIARGLAPSWWHPIKRYKWKRLILTAAGGTAHWATAATADKAYIDALAAHAVAQVNEEMRLTLGPLGLHIELDLSGLTDDG